MSARSLASAAAALLALVLILGVVLPRALAPDPEAWREAAVAGWTAGDAPEDVLAMRALNPEWDFMARTFLVLALADRVLADPDAASVPEELAAMDAAIADTLAADEAGGPRHWLLPYADARPWRRDGRSLFVDGEVLLMIGARRVAARAAGQPDAWVEETARRAARVEQALTAGPLPLAESYPDEGWTFCHALALAGLRLHEHLDGADHGAVRAAWVDAARRHLLDPDTGMLVSEFDLDGRHHDGPEGSSLFLVATALQLVDPALAAEQYALARTHLGDTWLSWAYAREWPAGTAARVDVDSGPIVPVLGASASASGFAIAASRAFGDDGWHARLRGSLGAAEAVMAVHPLLAEAADNPVGQAVVLWGLSFGPLWAEVGPPQSAGPTALGEMATPAAPATSIQAASAPSKRSPVPR